MRFFNNFLSMLKGPSLSCGLVCSAAHLNSHGSNRNRILLFRLGGLKQSLDQPASSALWPSCLGLCPAGSWKPPRICPTDVGNLCQYLIVVTVKSFSLKSELSHVTIASHPATMHLSGEFCSVFLTSSGTGWKLLGSPSSLLTERSSLSLSSQGMCSTPHHLDCPQLHSLQFVNFFLILGAQSVVWFSRCDLTSAE